MTSRTPAQIQRFLDDNMHRFDLGAQMLGDEPNAVGKPWDTATVRWCMVASWPYEQAAGNSSIPAVYKAINNAHPTYLCDRFYLPATPRDLRLLERHHIPIFGIESKHQLADFDVIGTSIAYPVLAMSWIKMLAVSDIPIRWRDRDPNTHPMVIVGGQSYGAPESLAPVVDCWWLGEVEDEPGNPGIGTVVARIARFKASGQWSTDRLGCYAALAREFRFLYFPRFVNIHYGYEDRSHVGITEHPSKQVIAYTSNLIGMRLPFTRRYVKDLDKSAPLVDPPLLYSDSAMGSGDLEVARGCPAFCSFCRLTYVSKPYRQRSVENIVEYADKFAQNMGSVRMAPFSPDFPMYTQRKKLIAALLERVSDEVDAPTMRVDDFIADNDFILLQVHGGMDTVTLGVEGNCLHGSTRVPVPGVGLLRIDELVGDAFNVGVSVGREVHSLEGGTRTGHRQLRRVVFSDGSELLATPEHLIRVLSSTPDARRIYLTPERRAELGVTSNYLNKRLQADDIGEVWRSVDDLRPGTVVRSYYGQMSWPHAYFNGFTENLAWLLGLLSGDGKVGPWGVEARVEDAGVEARVLAALRDMGVDGSVRVDERRCRIVTAYRRTLAYLLVRCGVSDTETRRCVPAAVWRSPRSVVAAYLTGVLDADGCVPHRVSAPKALTVVHGTHSEVFAREIGQLLAAFGHPVSLHRNVGRDGYVMWHTVIHSAPDVDWSWLEFSEDSRRQRLAAAVNRAGGPRTGQVTWRGGDQGVKYVKVQRVEPVDQTADVYDLHVPGALAFTANSIVVHNSQRMRDLIGKGTSDQDVKEAVTRGIRAGIRKFKLYMISNLPGEDEGDIFRILKLAKELADIRESMNQPTVQIQFSWTPLMIEANTPLQWFAPTPANRLLGDIWEELRDLKIQFKIGSKAEANKIAFFQLCQRASRDAGEALVDAMEEVGQACWGGVPQTFKETIEQKLLDHGFRNGFADCFDERFRNDMFGWEMIDQGISTELLWIAYLQMREFAEQTDSHTYDANFDSSYHGNEWIPRCDTHCMGKRCGACDHADLKIRAGYIRAAQTERQIDLSDVKLVDQRSQALRIRAQILKPAKYRLVGNDHWRFNVRRAAFRAQATLGADYSIAKRTIRFASDQTRYRDWTCGVDYLEFGITRRIEIPEIQRFLDTMNTELAQWMSIGAWALYPPGARSIRADVDLSLFELGIDADPATTAAQIQRWNAADHVAMRLKVDGGYFAPASEQVNAKDYVDDLWLVRDGIRLKLRMLIKGRPSPYNIYAALSGQPSWLDAAKTPAVRLDAFIATDRRQQDFLRPNCTDCALQIPTNILNQSYDPHRCPKCKDIHDGAVAKEMFT